MRRGAKVVLSAGLALVVALGAVVALTAELRTALLFRVSPGFASRRTLTRFGNSGGQTVYLVGTIHSAHLDQAEFSLWHLAAVVDHIRPALVLVESRPEELADGNWCDGPVEMGFVSLTAKSLAIDVRGMDSWQKQAGGTVMRSSDSREDEMFRLAFEQVADRRSAVVFTGFSHVAELSSRLRRHGFHEVEITPSEKRGLLSIDARGRLYPHGLEACLERRIDKDLRELGRETDAEWRSATEQNIAVRRRFLEQVSASAAR